MDIELRLAKIPEARMIAEMSRDFIETGLGWTWTPDRIAKQVRCADTLVLVAPEGGQLIGFACMRFREEDAHLNLLCVRRSHQRRGIGRRLMKWLETTALTAGIVSIHLEVRAINHGARRFYHALGYEEAGELRRYYRGRESAIRMVRHLRALRWSQANRIT
jgi:ribosomal-protein-alanine N-acetyltransferase